LSCLLDGGCVKSNRPQIDIYNAAYVHLTVKYIQLSC